MKNAFENATDILGYLQTRARALGASASDAVMFETMEMTSSCRLGKQEGMERSESSAVGLRVFIGDQQAIVSSTDMLKESLDETVERAVAMAKAASADPDSHLAPEMLWAKDLPALDLFDGTPPEPEWFNDMCKRAEDSALGVTGITNSEGADAHYSQHIISLAIDNGVSRAMHSYPTSNLSVSVSVLAGSGTDMERDYEFSSVRHRSDLTDPEQLGKQAATKALARINPRKIATQKAPILFDPRVSRSLLSVLASSISGQAIARGSSFLKDAMGTSLFASNVTIIDDPHLQRGLASKPFDGEGVANRKRALVENGVLQSWLLDVRTARKLNLETTGNATRGISSAPSPSASNLYMQKGTKTPKELMRDMQQGLYITETFGMGINTVTGDYSQGASGFWVENGEIAYPVSEITIAGHLRDMFARAIPANDLSFRYASNAPSVLMDGMTVAGV
jgi:PmbA protein